jgi:DNA-binding MarR family transcriptional regulator
MLIKAAVPIPPDLPTLVENLKAYLLEALGIEARLQDWGEVKRLPLFLAKAFAFKTARLGEQDLLAVLDKTGDWTSEGLAKQLQQLELLAKLPVVFATQTMTPQARNRLVAQRTPFVVPGQQLYLPFQGIVFKERYPARTAVGEHLAYATQAMLIHTLLKTTDKVFQPGPMARLLDYTPMTMTRAFNELQARGLAKGRAQGRNRLLEFKLAGRELWERAKPLMQNPLRKRLWLTHDTQVQSQYGLKAGLSALAERSDLAPPECPVYAVPPTGWGWAGITAAKKDVLPYAQSDAIEVQSWVYPPTLFTQDKSVDPLNLYLTLRDDPDERVQAALVEIEKRLW